MFMISYLIAANLFQSTMSRLQGAFIADSLSLARPRAAKLLPRFSAD